MMTSHKFLSFLYDITQYQSLKKIGIAILIMIAAGVIYGGYYWYSIRKDQEAQKMFAECLEQFERASVSHDESLWNDVIRAFDNGFERAQKSSFGPYFLAFKADALIRLKKNAEARETMRTMMSMMSSSSPLYPLYKIKYALMKIDADEALTKSEGLADLEKVAEDKKSFYQDMALYYRGYNAFMNGDIDWAQKLWTQLIRTYGAESLWSQMAQAKLEFTA